MSIELNSFSSALMLGVTLYRNKPEVDNKFIAQGAYAVIAVIAAVETAAALAFTALSLTVNLISYASFTFSVKWLSSSSFALGWSLTVFLMNPLSHTLVADEKSARQILHTGNVWQIPPGAIV